jgi:hypothetical protein
MTTYSMKRTLGLIDVPFRKLAVTALLGLSVLTGVSESASAGDGDWSIAREWNELLLESIRNDFARPPTTARNLHHISSAMHDAWALYEDNALGFLVDYDLPAEDKLASQKEAMSFAACRLLQARFSKSPDAELSLPLYDDLMDELGYDKNFYATVGDSPAAWGNRIAVTYLWYGLNDGSNETGDYDNLFYEPVNEPMVVSLPGNPTLTDPNRWQPLSFDFFIDQSGNVIPGATPSFLSPEWGLVTAFAITDDDITVHTRNGYDWPVAHDPGPPAYLGGKSDFEYKRGNEMVAIWSGLCDPSDGVMVDVSPNTIGNASLPASYAEWDDFYNFEEGGDWSEGYLVNPVTGDPYDVQMVPRGDYARILAEFWADGPDSETPPGHWFTILNKTTDEMDQGELRIAGEGNPVSRLEWDIKLYFTMGGNMHDAAIAAWGCKGAYDYIRPVSAIRWLCENGQCSDPAEPSYNINGINLMSGKIELVTAATTQIGERHAHLAGSEGKVALYAWRGPDFIVDPDVDVAGVGWILGESWWPYQRPTFVTPPFAAYVSGHSTYSRSAAEVMTLFTGNQYFPNGMGEFLCPMNEFLVFEDGPSMDVTLQWASYYDASDQCSLSRIFGGIHPRVDDIPGRKMGQIIGPRAFEKALTYWIPEDLCPWDISQDGIVDGIDLSILLGAWGNCEGCRPDINEDGVVNGLDLAVLIGHWGELCP